MNKDLRIMVVDDSLLTVIKLKKILFELGHAVIHSSKTGKEAIEHYQQYKPDLITMDITMPDMDGIEATRKIIKIDPGALIIMITSHGQEKKVLDAIEAGAKGYVLKPVRKEKLGVTIDQVITAYRQ